jgi:mono/diheme cytochrome c family protein
MRCPSLPQAGFVLTALHLLAAPTLGCERHEAWPPIPSVPAGSGTARVQAKFAADSYYESKCLTCHGSGGRGDGPGAAALMVKPRAFTDPAWQQSVTDAHLRRVILQGGQAVGLSEDMTPFSDLDDQPRVLTELVAKIRRFSPDPP